MEILVPHHLAGLLVGGDHAAIERSDREHQIAPQRHAAVAVALLLAGVHLPHGASGFSRPHVDLVDDAPVVDDVHEAVLDQRRRLDGLVAVGAADRDREQQLEVLDVVLVDLLERREPLGIVAAVNHQPVLRLLVGICEPLIGHLGRGCAGDERRRRNRAGEQEAAQGCVLHGVASSHLVKCSVRRISSRPISLPVFGEGRVGFFFPCSLRSWTPPLPPRRRGGRRDHSPNTNSMVALVWVLSSGERAIFALPTGPMPEAMAMYCLPFTA